MFGLGATELVIILVIVIVLFGARRLPEIGSGVGKAIKNFRAGMSSESEIDVTPANEDDSTQAKSPTEQKPVSHCPEGGGVKPIAGSGMSSNRTQVPEDVPRKSSSTIPVRLSPQKQSPVHPGTSLNPESQGLKGRLAKQHARSPSPPHGLGS